MAVETGIKEFRPLPVGKSDFKTVIEGNYCYIDKSLFIKEVIDRGDTILLIPRPRRFGKTLNLSMLKYFYDCIPDTLRRGSDSKSPGIQKSKTGPSNEHIFDSLAIMEAGDKYLDKMGQFPVIFLSFRDVKEQDWETCFSKTKQLIQEEYLKHEYLLSGELLHEVEKNYFNKVLHLKGNKGDYENSLKKLLIFLYRYYGKRAVILIDEYDSPIHAGFNHGYYTDVIGFMRNFLSGGLKDTDQYLEKCVLTGILRVAKESIFSGLNNPGVFTLLSKEFDDKFGFTEKEVEILLRDFQVLDIYEQVKEWYNGYRFGKQIIYNPWSIINFLANEEKECKPYWINTSDNAIIETLLAGEGKELKTELEQLIRGESIEKAVEENILLKDISTDEDLLWSFLLMTGYLKQTDKRIEDGDTVYYNLSIPNLEVRTAYKGIIRRYFTGKIGNRELEIMLKALLDGEIDVFEEIFAGYVVRAMSFFDMGGEPEKVYHAFVMGLLLWISKDYQIKSNRESGYGRYDIMIIPEDKSKLGFIIEFKKVRPKETVKTAVKAALKQIEEKKYETELKERGIKTYKKLAIVFNGKDVTIKESGKD
ncbi:MAG: AAA family ATPase [bacterium]|nr:AAA family ATPase [bacterium]